MIAINGVILRSKKKYKNNIKINNKQIFFQLLKRKESIWKPESSSLLQNSSQNLKMKKFLIKTVKNSIIHSFSATETNYCHVNNDKRYWKFKKTKIKASNVTSQFLYIF